MNLFLKFVYGDLLQPNDTFRDKVRKICLAVAFVASIPLFCANILDSLEIHDDPNHPEYGLILRYVSNVVANVSNNVSGYCIAFVFMGCWATCRFTKHAGDALMNVIVDTTVTAEIG